MTEKANPKGTTAGANPQTGSSDAARGLGGHSKDADHASGKPAAKVEDSKPKPEGTERSKTTEPL